LAETCIEFFVESTANAKAALVAIEQYVPKVRSTLTKGRELPEAYEPVLRQIIENRRVAAIKSERLFRQRRLLSR
jgi:hypothetical protein